MKKLLACALIFVMCLGSLAACGKEPEKTDVIPTTAPTTAPTEAPVEDTVSDLVNAKNYLYTMYKDQTEATPVDYTVVGVVNIGGVLFPIEWTVDNDTVKIVPGDNKMVTIDVDDKNPEEVTYVLTATLKDDKGNTETCSFTHRVPAAIILDAGMSYADIVDAAYTLEDGLAMEGTFRLYGTITKVDTPWSADYKNITVTIAVAGKEDKPIMCYRLKGDGAENLKVGDAITVEGSFKNYKGTIEYDAGCVLVGYGEHKDYTALLDAAYTLEDGLAMNEPCTMSGVIHNIDTAWSEDYQNITVSITVNGVADKPIMCYRLSGEGAKDLAVGDYITVTGTIKNYKGTIEFDKGCTLDNVVKAAGSDEPVEEKPQVDPTGMSAAEILDAAYALESGEAFGAPCTLTGVITSIDTAYSEQYGNITVTIVVDGKEDKKIQCFRLVGDGNADLAVGDTITVTGTITNYNGKVQYNAKCTLDAVVKGAEAPAGEGVTGTFSGSYVGDYSAEWIPADAFAGCENGATVTLGIELQTEGRANQWWNLTFIKGDWSKYLDAKYYLGEVPAFSQYEFIAMDSDSYTFTLSAEAIAQINTDGKFGIQTDGVIFHTYSVTPAEAEEVVTPAVDYSAMTPAELLDAAYALAAGEAFTAPCTLTGVITSVDQAYSEQYGNITVTIVVDGNTEKPVQCFRLVGDGNADLAVGDIITVTGTIKNFNGTIEFDAKCTLDAVVKAEGGDAPAATTATGIDLSAGLTAGVDYNGIVVMDDMKVLDDSAYEIEGVAYPFCVQGSVNPKPKNGEIPTEGAAVKVTPAADGTFKVVFKLGNGKSYHMIDDAMTVIDTYLNETGASEYLVKEYKVEAGKTYYFYGNGTKLPIYFIGLN